MADNAEILARMVPPTIVFMWLKYNIRAKYEEMRNGYIFDAMVTFSTQRLFVHGLMRYNFSAQTSAIPASAISTWLQVHFPQEWLRLDANGCLNVLLSGANAPVEFCQFRCFLSAAMLYNHATNENDNIAFYLVDYSR